MQSYAFMMKGTQGFTDMLKAVRWQAKMAPTQIYPTANANLPCNPNLGFH